MPGTRCCGAPHHCGADLPKQAREASHHAGHRVRAIADLGALRAGHPCGAGLGRDGTGRGSEAAPRAILTRPPPCGEGRSAAMTRSPARHRRPCIGLAARWTCLVHGQAQAWVMGGPGCPDTTMPVPGLFRPGRRRPSPVCSSYPPGILQGEPQRSSAPHPLAPCGGDARPPFRMDWRAPRPGCVLTDLNLHRRSFRCSRSPRRPVVTARKQPCVFHTRGRCARVEPPPAPFASRHGPSGWSNIRPDRSRLATSALRCAGLFARRPGPKPVHGASPAGDWRPGGPCLPRPLPDVAASPRRNPQPATSRSPVQKLHPLSYCGLRRTPASAERLSTGLPRG